MKLVIFAIVLVGFAAADVSHLSRQAVLDSATQGPNPQDIATPEPEYIDIDLPEPPRPAPVSRSHVSGLNIIPSIESSPTHTFSASGYRYKRPVVYKRTHRHRF